MKAQNLIASVAAVLFTFASLSAVNYNVDSQPAPASKTSTTPIIDLAPVQVRPSAAEMRTAALLNDIGVAGVATIPVSAFYRDDPERRYLRLCFAKEDATLDAAIERLASFRRH